MKSPVSNNERCHVIVSDILVTGRLWHGNGIITRRSPKRVKNTQTTIDKHNLENHT